MTYRPRRWLAIIPLTLITIGSLALHHRLATGHQLPPVAGTMWAAGFAAVILQQILAWTGRPYTADPPPLNVVLIIPAYNEDPALLERVLASVRVQTRKPQRVIVCDDGSTVDYRDVIAAYPEATWLRQPNQGKKHAQAACFKAAPEADIFITIDSDSALEPHAIEEGLRPFADRRIQAVAGLEWAHNYTRNILTRAIGARSVAFQLSAMSSQSAAWGNVLIAPGAFSLYRARVIFEALPAYIGETFAGVPVVLGDDTMLTFFALMRGRVVQQVTAVAFPTYPEKVGHHLRQWVRWMRASTIRQIWRLRFLPLASYGWWFSVWQLGAFTAGTAASVLIVAAWPHSLPLALGAAGGLLAWPLILSCRLACLSRSDLRWWQTATGVALMPLAALWYLIVLRQLRFYGIATCSKQGWVTRRKVEVRLHDDDQREAPPQGPA